MRHTQWFVTLVLLSLLTATASNQCAAGQSNEQIFVSSDSPPGWKPTEAQKELASKTLAAFFTALDHDAYADAYNLHSDLLKRQMSSQQFEDISKKFRFAAGRAGSGNLDSVISGISA